MAGASDRLLQYDAGGVPRIGSGLPWHSPSFNDSSWLTAPGPFGFGSFSAQPAVPIATRVEASVRYLTPTLYLRRTFSVSEADAARSDALQLVVQYNDGFVAYLNGVEIARRNGGPPGKFIFHDQPAYNRETFSATAPIPTVTYGESIMLGSAASLLQPGGNNVLAIHALNANTNDATFYIRADLRISGSPAVTLVNYNDQWRYLPGVLEPSGNFYDPALLGSGKLNVPWGQISFDDGEWASGNGPIGAGSVNGTVPVTNLATQVVNKSTSVYMRTVFSADAAAVGELLPLLLAVQYDDGFVAYINGVEVARRRIGLPNTFTPHDVVADSDNTGSPLTETITLDIPSRLLTEGNNVLAVQVHNSNISSTDLYLRADLRTGSGRTLSSGSTTWKYHVGTVEPVPDPTGEEEEATAEGPDSAADWIELHNTGAEDVNLTGWSLTDDPGETRKWLFPNVTIPAGGYLVVFADGLDLKNNPGGYLHTNFSLSKDGEYVGLYDMSGALVSQIAPAFPRQGPFHSYTRTEAGLWRFSDTPTPGAQNSGALFEGIVTTPTVNNPGRFYPSSISVTFTTTTAGATLRYTTNGSEPTLASTAVTGAITVPSSGAVFRVRAFRDGWIPSDTITHTYLINQSTARRSLPAVCITGDIQRALYRPFGIFAISPNGSTAYTNGIWSQYIGNSSGNLTSPNVAPDPMAYNAPMQSGKPAERPVSFEILHDNATPDLRIEAGIRTAGSPYSRPRYVLNQQNSSPTSTSVWSSSATEKPQLNLFFRDDLHQRPLNYPLIPGSVVGSYENIRLRAGKNDISNPFIRDEFTRRLHRDMGQVTVRGDFVTLFVNGIYKGYYNICERPREKFFQEARGTASKFDVRYITAITDGDVLAYNELVAYARTRDPSVYANYLGYMDRVDVVNIADYLILNAYAAMADWPGNNYVMDRERSSSGRYRFSVWDGEGGFGGFSRNPAYRNTFTGDLNSSNVTSESVPAKLLYTQLRKSPEWRLLFADRIQKHFFNSGALDTTNVTARYNELRSKIQPLIGSFNEFLGTWLNGVGTDRTRYTLSGGTTGSIVNVPSRRTVLFDGFYDDTQSGSPFVQGLFVSQGLWPATRAPVLSQSGGNVAAGFQLTISNPNAAGTIYYTTDGKDPRAVGGVPQGASYTGPITISQTTEVRARVRNTNGEWSPVSEATFVVAGQVPLLLTEIMYNPQQGTANSDEFEFLELKNIGTQTLNLNGMAFTDGISFTFPEGATLVPGAFAVLVKDPTLFASRYPGVSIAGVYGPASSLSNSGELLTLRDVVGNTIFSVSYSDHSPWPAAADGFGNSVVVVNPNSNPNPNDPVNWRASAAIGGSPGADDPEPTLPAVLVNEVLPFPVAPQIDAIELFNPTTQPASIGGWFLSDDITGPKKFRIPDDTVIPPGGYVVFTETDFNPTPGVGASFGLGQGGDEVRLNSADSAGNLTGYTHGFGFGAAARGVSFGRYITGTNRETFPAQSAVTLGAANAGPLIGPVVITEIMYNPVTGGDEFLELRNISGSAVPLFDPANPSNTWRVDGLGSTTSVWPLPAGLTLAPRQFMILTEIDPETFRSRYGIPASVPIYQYPGALSNGGENLAVQKPGTPYTNNGQLVVPYIDVDAITYDDAAPWPTSADGTGPSLERINWRAFANDSGNWRVSAANGGNPAALAPVNFAGWQSLFFSSAEVGNAAISGLGADPDGDGLSNLEEFAAGLDPRLSDGKGISEVSLEPDGGNGPYLTLRYRRSLSAQNVQHFVDTAAGLGAWNLGDSTQIGTAVNNGDGTETITRRDTTPVSGAGQRFIRLRVLGN